MNRENQADNQLHENLKAIGQSVDVPPGPSEQFKNECQRALASNITPSRPALWRRPAVLSTLGMAAAIAMAFGIFNPFSNAPRVEAATVLAKLNQQIADNPLVEVTLDSIRLEEVSIHGRLQVAEHAVAGDIHAVIEEGGEESITVDMALGISEQGGWVLVRELVIPDPQAAVVLGMFLPPGRDTLIVLPGDMLNEDGRFDTDIHSAFKELASEEILALLAELQESQDELGITVEERADGMLVFTLPITDADVLMRLESVLAEVGEELSPGGVNVNVGADIGNARVHAIKTAPPHPAQPDVIVDVRVESRDAHDVELDGDDDVMALIGTTVYLVYDPDAEQVREVVLTEFGDNKGTISIVLRDGQIDPALLDSDRFTDEKTHVLDVGAIIGAFGN